MIDPLTGLLPAVMADDLVLGLILGGSRGKGLGTERSDWDVYLVVADGVRADDIRAALDLSHPRLDLCGVHTAEELANHAAVGSSDEWNRYTFAHVTPTVDKTGGLLQKICDEKEFLPEQVAQLRAAALLDSYVNSYYRSLKNYRDGNIGAGLLDAAESVPRLLAFVFTAEKRVVPYNKFLAWELSTHPLANPWWARETLIESALRIVRTGDVTVQANCFRAVEHQARELGHGAVLDAWGAGALTAMRTAGGST